MDVDIRLLRYFAEVAHEGNLTRAAERLYLSQPALTKQLKKLENLLGVQLFVRSRTGMSLTEPGRVLWDRIPHLLTEWDQAFRATRVVAARAARVLRVGFLASAANEATPQIIAAFTDRRPQWRVEMRQATWTDPTAGLADGDVDAAFVRMPFPAQDALKVEVLFDEPRWLALPTAHPLAKLDRLSFDQLWDEPFVAAPAETGWWRDYWLGTDERAGRPPRIGAVANQPDEWLTAIANGYGVALAPRSASRFYARPGVAYRPVTGVSASQVGVAWHPATGADPVIRDFVRCCLEHAPRPTLQSADPGGIRT